MTAERFAAKQAVIETSISTTEHGGNAKAAILNNIRTSSSFYQNYSPSQLSKQRHSLDNQSIENQGTHESPRNPAAEGIQKNTLDASIKHRFNLDEALDEKLRELSDPQS